MTAEAGAARSAKRWFWSAVATQAVTLAVYFGWRAGWDVFHGITNGSTWLCLVMWGRRRGFVNGWRARSDRGG